VTPRAVLVTRPAGEADALVVALEGRGVRVHAVPTIAVEPVAPGGPLDDAAARPDEYHWIVVTSAEGARALADALQRAARAGSPPGPMPRLAAVGPATARALRAAGLGASVVPAGARGAAIADAMAAVEPLGGARVLLARADIAGHDLPARLRSLGASVDEVTAYRTVEGPEASRAGLIAALGDPALRAAVVASGSAVRGLVALAGTWGADRLRALHLVSIGPVTSAAIRSAGLALAVEASSPSVDGLVAAVLAVVDTPPAHPSGHPALHLEIAP
jgi:uroporphyrinogen-III synthase